MAYRRRNRLRRRNARPSTKRAFKRTGRGIKGVSAVAYRRPGYGNAGLGAFGTRLGRMGRQRNAARAALLMQRRRRRAGTGGGGEIGWVHRRGGKYRPYTVGKLLTLGQAVNTFRFQGVRRMNEDSAQAINADGSSGQTMPGYFSLQNTPPDANGSELYPIHAFDLTNINNISTDTGPVSYYMFYDNAGSVNYPNWFVQSGQAASGSNTNGWNIEDQSMGAVTAVNRRYVQHDWFDIRMVCYGCRQQPTYYDIMVVSYYRDYLQPCGYTDVTQLDAEQKNAYRAYWQGMIKNISYNAILPGQRDAFKGMRVHRRFRFTIQPSQTTDSDRNPHMRIVKFFMKDYKIRDYNWGKYPSLATEVDSAKYAVDGGGGVRNHPREDQRLFLIVRASNTTPASGENVTADNTPSYDICIRKQVRYLPRD